MLAVVILVILLAWDVRAAVALGYTTPGAALSFIAWHKPTPSFIVGLLAGHLVAPPLAHSLSVAGCALLVFICVSVFAWLESVAAPPWCMVVLPLVAGVAAGFLWMRQEPSDWRNL